MVAERLRCWWFARRFPGYLPQEVTGESLSTWIRQFQKPDRPHLWKLLKHVRFVTEREVRDSLVNQNSVIRRRLADAGVQSNNIIYMQVHDAGSSSGVMLNALRDSARLERSGCHFIDSKDVLSLSKLTNELGEGAIVYVDDFAGTGNQFCEVRDFVAQHIIGSFTEFVLLVGACEEAVFELGKKGVEPFAEIVHTKADRPLHPSSRILPRSTRERLRHVAMEIDSKGGLGYRGLATMVVLYRNAPNTVPLILRGSMNQAPLRGIFPRTTDLPALSTS